MKKAINDEDQKRLAVLNTYELLNTPPENPYDEITKLAALICDAPISLISLSYENRQFFKSRYGLEVSEMSRSGFFCSDAIAFPKTLSVVPDARLDERYTRCPFVTGPPHFIFYAGMPLVTPSGFALGTLCVIDHEPRSLGQMQKETLQKLANQVITLMELQRKNRVLKVTENLFKESEKNYKLLFDASPIPKILLDVGSMKILETNKAAEQKYGYSRDELKGEHIAKLLTEEEVNSFQKRISNLNNTQGPMKLDSVIHRNKKGELIQAEMILHQINFKDRNCILTVVNDLAEKIKIEHNKSHLASILENSLNEIYIFDTINLQFIYANKGAVKNLGYSLDELKTLKPSDIKPEFDESSVRKFLEPLSTGEKELLIMESTHRRKNGSLYEIEVHVQKIKYLGKQAFLALVIDISHTKATERKLKKLNRLLEKSNEELSHFAYVTAHDLQEPLRMVSSFTTLLARKYHDLLDEKGKSYIHYTVDGAKRMQQLIHDILEYSKPGGIVATNESIPLQAILEHVLNDLKTHIGFLGAHVNIPNEIVVLRGNQNALYRLFLNLTSNALKFIPKTRKPQITITSENKSDHWLFSVRDNGIGIEENQIETLFKPFNRLPTEKKTQGTGLGLATCKKIVEHHGGNIWVESQPGEGSQFFFTLPK